MSGPLAGIRVLDLTINVLGPLAAQILGDMGADVIKIEAPGGDPMRHTGKAHHAGMASLFLNTNRNKRSVVLDLKRADALRALMALVDEADVLIHSMRPSTVERLGLAYEAVRARNPRIIYAHGPGYRPDGPHRDRPAFDDVIQGETGVAGMMEQSLGEPRYAPMVLADKLCGHALASAVGMALFCRERTGDAQEVIVPMFETMLSFNLVEHLWTDFFDADRDNLGYSRMFSTHRRPYATRDGHLCMLAVSDEQWRRVFQVIGRPELAADARFAKLQARTRNIDALYEIVASQLATKTSAQWQQLLDAADLPNGRVNTFATMADDPYLQETGFFRHYEHPTEGPLVTPEISTLFARTPGSVRLVPPHLGEHTYAVLRESGYTDASIESMSGMPPPSV